VYNVWLNFLKCYFNKYWKYTYDTKNLIPTTYTLISVKHLCVTKNLCPFSSKLMTWINDKVENKKSRS
jgi:hypothetical protein